MAEPQPPLQPMVPSDEAEGVYQSAQELLVHQENVAEGDEPKTATIPQGEWDWAKRYTNEYNTMSADWLTKYSHLRYGEACAVIEELQSVGRLSRIYDFKTGGYLVLKDDFARQQELSSVKLPAPPKETETPKEGSRIRRALGKLSMQPSGSSAVDIRDPRQVELDRINAAWEAGRKWNLVIGDRPLVPAGERRQAKDGRPAVDESTLASYFEAEKLAALDADMKKAVFDAVHKEKETRGVVKLPSEDFKRIANKARRQVLRDYLGGNPSDDLMGLVEKARRDLANQQASPDRENTTSISTATPVAEKKSRSRDKAKPSERQEKVRERASDEWELGLMYLAGTLHKEGKQPPAMSALSLANRYVRYFKLDREGIDAGLSEQDARKQALDKVMPMAEEHFARMQKLGFVTEDYAKIDPNDPAHDTSATGHRVIKDSDTINEELRNYRQQRAA